MTYPSTVGDCFCARCAGKLAPAQCSACGEEVRYGRRGDMVGYLHREDVGHAAILGHRHTVAEAEAWLHQYVEVERIDEKGEAYTTAVADARKDKDTVRRKRRLAELAGEDPDYVAPLPEPEVRRTPITLEDLPPRSGIRQIANLVLKTEGWELTRLTRARGPYMGASMEVLSISDSVVLNALGPELDDGRAIAVGSWRDGSFDTAYAGRLRDGAVIVEPVNAGQLKSWIKEPS